MSHQIETARINADHDAKVVELVQKGFTCEPHEDGDIFTRDGLRVRLVRPLCSARWVLRDVDTLAEIQYLPTE